MRCDNCLMPIDTKNIKICSVKPNTISVYLVEYTCTHCNCNASYYVTK